MVMGIRIIWHINNLCTINIFSPDTHTPMYITLRSPTVFFEHEMASTTFCKTEPHIHPQLNSQFPILMSSGKTTNMSHSSKTSINDNKVHKHSDCGIEIQQLFHSNSTDKTYNKEREAKMK